MNDRARRIAKSYRKLTDMEVIHIDASAFMDDLQGVAAALTNLVEREGEKIIPHSFMHKDFGLILRHCRLICNLLTNLNAEERLEKDATTKQEYSFALLPLIRTLIDGFYNVTVMLQDRTLARNFRASGYKQALLKSENDAKMYGTNRRFLDHHYKVVRGLSTEWKLLGFDESEIRSATKWTLLSSYLRNKPVDTPHKILLQKLTLGYWYEYSSLSHGTFDGLRSIAPFINKDMVPQAWQEDMELGAYRIITMHMARAEGILLCLLTELQSAYRFEGFRVNERLLSVWRALIVLPEIRELFELRYKELMASRGIGTIS